MPISLGLPSIRSHALISRARARRAAILPPVSAAVVAPLGAGPPAGGVTAYPLGVSWYA
ncbi:MULTISPECIES: hypothetical protein [Catenuloplanes]|uniref:Uncharacterized protein n=1 Tax=Catenuloplanes niger TaxID=587534 RepID=A0AAE4CZL8_9ACTN|nr:hypothetical protein [Catenuloplanes niger]MDR7327029.1 hypothetical protein [Catenuloplanes niger]